MKTDVQPQITILKYSKLGKSSSIFGTLFLKKKAYESSADQLYIFNENNTVLYCVRNDGNVSRTYS